jgi:hypothetical protein
MTTKKQNAQKVWMVEQLWNLGPAIIPVRSVVKAATRSKAQRGAARAILDALIVLLKGASVPGHAVSNPVVLYAMGPAELIKDWP